MLFPQQGARNPGSSTKPPTQPSPIPPPTPAPAGQAKAAPPATPPAASSDAPAKPGLSPVWWLAGGAAALGALYAANLYQPQQQVQQTKQYAEQSDVSPVHSALLQESSQSEPDSVGTQGASAQIGDSQEQSTVTGQPSNSLRLFTGQEQQSGTSHAQSHSTFHTDELAMPSNAASPGANQPHGEPESFASRDNVAASAASSALSSSNQSADGAPQQNSNGNSSHDQNSGSSPQHAEDASAADVHRVDRAHDSGIEAAVSIDPTPMTDLLNEALTGEMLHPEHPGHERTTLDDPAPDATLASKEASDLHGSDGSPDSQDRAV